VTTVPADVNWRALSPESRETLTLAALISSGLSATEAGQVYGLSNRQVSQRMARLRAEILERRLSGPNALVAEGVSFHRK
jgi:DNA-directed RNA polymerase specialized sigma24 family protein